ncbi:hypothetical protein MOE66_15220 [Bacillus atrophaeus]|uniref:hypothetical protein n=1 Tax=Bacillus atrophaeus TaxID=1452 RepID=UPI002280E7A0|nr:hypothetical protein [Bacillus atrophaeus]MCY9136003.1 hypothetical protein [Bacillus atrophaeus]
MKIITDECFQRAVFGTALLFKLYSEQQQQSSIEFVAIVPSEVDVRLRKTIAIIR